MIKAAWDEIAAMWQLIARGIVGYVQTVGTPPPKDLHLLDTTFYHSVLTALGTRHTANRSSLTTTRAVEGLQLPSVVEAVVIGVANETVYLLNGDTTASKIARHALYISMCEDPSKS